MEPKVTIPERAPSLLRMLDAALQIGLVALLIFACSRIILPFAGILLWSVILAVMLAVTWWGGAGLRLGVEDRIALLMCGSKKSLATGLPMAAVLFPVAVAGTIAVPVIVFHQLQLIVCAVLARRLALRDQA